MFRVYTDLDKEDTGFASTEDLSKLFEGDHMIAYQVYLPTPLHMPLQVSCLL